MERIEKKQIEEMPSCWDAVPNEVKIHSEHLQRIDIWRNAIPDSTIDGDSENVAHVVTVRFIFHP